MLLDAPQSIADDSCNMCFAAGYQGDTRRPLRNSSVPPHMMRFVCAFGSGIYGRLVDGDAGRSRQLSGDASGTTDSNTVLFRCHVLAVFFICSYTGILSVGCPSGQEGTGKVKYNHQSPRPPHLSTPNKETMAPLFDCRWLHKSNPGPGVCPADSLAIGSPHKSI
jgi:hypothetical protein